MAESQVPFTYTAAEVTALSASLSRDRYATYLKEAKGSHALAFDLYIYNARLAKAFLCPLSMAEVTLRNAIDRVLVGIHGPDWPIQHSFQKILSVGSLDSLNRALGRIAGPFDRGQVVATLTFDFWSNLFRPEYDRAIWQVHLRRVLPHLPTQITRPDVQNLVRDINQLRNRRAHHEPIFRLDVTKLHSDIVKLVAYCCPDTAGWVRHFSTIASAIRTKPRGATPVKCVKGRCDMRFQIVRAGDSLSALLSAYSASDASIVCVDGNGEPVQLLTAADVAAFTASKAQEAGGMVAFEDHTVADMIAARALGQWSRLDIHAPEVEIARTFDLATNMRGIVVTETVEGIAIPHGVILRAHRRY